MASPLTLSEFGVYLCFTLSIDANSTAGSSGDRCAAPACAVDFVVSKNKGGFSYWSSLSGCEAAGAAGAAKNGRVDSLSSLVAEESER